jgi:hypothetical protein
MKRSLFVLLFAGLAGVPAITAAQEGLAAVCSQPEVSAEARDYCLVAAQALTSAQPQLGILLAGGNPTLGTASTGGLRLGFLPRVSATGKLNLVFVRLPDILAEGTGTVGRQLNRTVGIPAPALAATASVGIFPGIDLLPMVGGIGSIDLLGSATWLPLRVAGIEGVGTGTSSGSLGGGVRLGLLRESFVAPGVSASLMYRRLGQLEYGDVCPSPAQSRTRPAGSASLEYGSCPGGGDPGEFSFDLSNWSTRIAAGKRLLGFGLVGGIGYDRFSSDVGFGFREPGGDFYARVSDDDLRSGRWSGFLNGSFTALVATLAVEGGWMQGGDPIPGFDAATSDFAPDRGTLFGSVGVRVAF